MIFLGPFSKPEQELSRQMKQPCRYFDEIGQIASTKECLASEIHQPE